jgi:hypothetical protein
MLTSMATTTQSMEEAASPPLRSRDGSVAGPSSLAVLVWLSRAHADDARYGAHKHVAGLFSDGFSQSIIGPVNTMLKILYKDEYTKSSAQQNVSSIAFAGTVLGQCTNICELESAQL